MGQTLPSTTLFGAQECDDCGAIEGPHYFDGQRIRCIRCEIHRMNAGLTFYLLVQWILIAVGGLAIGTISVVL